MMCCHACTCTLLHNNYSSCLDLLCGAHKNMCHCRYHDKLHSKLTSVPMTFKELRAFLPQVESSKEAAKQIGFPIGVMIAGDDSLIMRHQVEATADYFGVQPVALPGLAHDVMLVSLCFSASQAQSHAQTHARHPVTMWVCSTCTFDYCLHGVMLASTCPCAILEQS